MLIPCSMHPSMIDQAKESATTREKERGLTHMSFPRWCNVLDMDIGREKKRRLERIIFSSPAPLIKATCERQRWTCKKEKRQRNRSRSKIKHSRLGEGYHIASFILRFVHGRNNERHVAVRASAEESEKISSNRRKERERECCQSFFADWNSFRMKKKGQV